MKAKRSRPRIVGYEILRRVEPGEVSGYPLDPRKDRAVLGVQEQSYLVPPDVDVFELGLIHRPGPHELLPIDEDDRPLWDDVIDLLVSEAEATRQRELLRRAYRTLCEMIAEADELAASVDEWSRRGEAHPIFGMLRLAMIDVWAARRRGLGPLGARELDALHAEVARRVAARIHAHVVGPIPAGDVGVDRGLELAIAEREVRRAGPHLRRGRIAPRPRRHHVRRAPPSAGRAAHLALRVGGLFMGSYDPGSWPQPWGSLRIGPPFGGSAVEVVDIAGDHLTAPRGGTTPASPGAGAIDRALEVAARREAGDP